MPGEMTDNLPFAKLLEKIAFGILLLDRQDTIRYANAGAGRLLNAQPSDLLGTTLQFDLPEDGGSLSIPSPREGVKQLVVRQTSMDLDGQSHRLVTLIEASHETSESGLFGFLEQSPDGIVLTDEKGNITFWNRAQEQISGLHSDLLLGKPLWEAMFAETPREQRREGLLNELRTIIERILAQGYVPGVTHNPIERSTTSQDGSPRVVQNWLFPIQTEAGWQIGNIHRDITQSSQAQSELKKQNSELRRQLEAYHRALQFETQERKRFQRERGAIYSIVASLRMANTERELASVFLSRLGDFIENEAGALLLYESDKQNIKVIQGFGLWETMTGTRLSASFPANTYMLASGQVYINNNVNPSDPAAPEGQLRKLRSVLAAPLIAENQNIGAIWLGRKMVWSQEEADILAATADLVANGLQRLRSADVSQRQVRHLSALHKIDQAIAANLEMSHVLNVLLAQVTTVLGLDAAGVSLFSEKTQTLEMVARQGFHTGFLRAVRLRLGEGGAGKAALERRIIHISDLYQAAGAARQTDMLLLEGFVTYYAVPLIAKGEVKGVLELFHRSQFDPDSDWLDFLETLAGQAAIVIDHAELFEELEQSNVDLGLAYENTLRGWARALELRHQETKGHSERVTNLTVEMARLLGFGGEELDHIRRGAILHDVGKMGIPDSILLKPGPLTRAEWEIMRLHPVYAYEMLSSIKFLRPALEIPHAHHERWDGSGYPHGLIGEEIPMPARIFAVADVYDALTHERPYHGAWAKDKAVSYLKEQKSRHFYAPVVELFIDHFAPRL